MAIRDWKDIPLFKDVTEEQWNDWHWQVEHRLTTVEEICQVVNLTEQEKADIEKVMGGFRVGITPYYASLMGPGRSEMSGKNAGSAYFIRNA